MIRLPERLRIISAVGALTFAVVLFVVGALVLATNLRLLRDSFGWVHHTDDVLLQISGIEKDLIAAESAERGYLLTANSEYAANYDHVRTAITQQIADLSKLVADNTQQVGRVNDLRQTAEARLSQLKQVIDLGPDHMDLALAVIRAAAPMRLTAVVGEKLDVLRGVELDLRRQRQERADHDMTGAIVLAVGITLLALLTGAVGLFLFQRERAGHRERVLQTELIHLSRLNTMGQTAAMLAHEINQPLTATANYLAAAQAISESFDPPRSTKATEVLQRAGAQLERAGDIVRRLRNFVEKADQRITIEDVTKIFEESVMLLGIKSEGLQIVSQVDPDLPRVIVDKIQIQQVLINLMRNAVEAMEASQQRLLELSAIAETDGMVRVSVKDTGPGLPKDVADRLFQAFVSTKESGMGVGLSICRTIVEGNGGRIWPSPIRWAAPFFHFRCRKRQLADEVKEQPSGIPHGAVRCAVPAYLMGPSAKEEKAAALTACAQPGWLGFLRSKVDPDQ